MGSTPSRWPTTALSWLASTNSDICATGRRAAPRGKTQPTNAAISVGTTTGARGAWSSVLGREVSPSAESSESWLLSEPDLNVIQSRGLQQCHDVRVTQSDPVARSGRPPSTSRAQILAGARELIERDGWRKLTIRHLAGHLGVGAATLYHHVRDREDLLVQLLDDHVAGLVRPALPDDPRERIVAVATMMHDSVAAAPWAAEVLIADDLVGESSFWMVEAIVAAAMECGLEAGQAADLYRSVWYFTVGEILVRAHSAVRREQRSGPSFRDGAFRRIDPERLPQLAALADSWPMIAARDTYPRGLRALVDGLLQGVVSTRR
jgi:AcrR family transcriptional regulator